MRRVAALGVVFPVVALPIQGVAFAASVAVGAALAVGNFWLIAKGVSAFVSGERTSQYKAVFVLKFSVVITGLYLLFDAHFVQGAPLLIGLSVLPIGIVVSQSSPTGSLKRG